MQIMKQPQTIALAAILVVAVGMVGLNGVQGNFLDSNNASSTNEGASMIGHVIVTHFDKDGAVIGYQQMDNTVTAVGKNCAANLVFGTNFANCGTPGVFDFIALSSAAATHGDEDTTLASECSSCGSGLDTRLQGTVTASTIGANGVDPIVLIRDTFTKGDSGTANIAAAGLFDALTNGNMFAAKNFTTSVTIDQNESLQVDWLITLAAPFTD